MAKRPVKTFERRSSVRGYTYRVTVSAVTGKVRDIVAGCRIWRSFEAAFAHYRGAVPGPQTDAWTDKSIDRIKTLAFIYAKNNNATKFDEHLDKYVYARMARHEARSILVELSNDVDAYRFKMERTRRGLFGCRKTAKRRRGGLRG